jgi:hypothetical protein
MARAEARAALALANHVRVDRAAWKRQIAEDPNVLLGLLDIVDTDVFPPIPESLRRWKVWDAVYAIPKLGDVRTRKVLRDAGVDVSRTLGALTPRQRLALVEALEAVRQPPPPGPGRRREHPLW